eukprot:15352-Eustigmatos_ZCMA.PRE.1
MVYGSIRVGRAGGNPVRVGTHMSTCVWSHINTVPQAFSLKRRSVMTMVAQHALRVHLGRAHGSCWRTP